MATRWEIPTDLWKNQTVAILASGPSLKSQPIHLLQGRCRAVAVNDTAKSVPWADLLYAADSAWWLHNSDWALKHPGLLVTASESVPFKAVKYLKPTGNSGFETAPGSIRTGMNSGYQAMHVAISLGASRILLFGFDFTLDHGVHHHGEHPRPLSNPSASLLANSIHYFNALAAVCEKRGIVVMNFSPVSKLRQFPKHSVEELPSLMETL